jgi:ubiquinone/menaquinone biosynthesis C-methylase UbiE
MRKFTINQKIVEEFFSSQKVISYYSRPRLYLSEKKLFKKYLKKGKVLDLCCGSGRVAIPLAKMGFDVVGIDNNLKMIKAADKLKRKFNLKNIKFVCADASKVKFKKEQFDYVLIMENSLEIIPYKEKREAIFKNAYNFLKKNGLFIASFQSYFYPIKIAFRLFFHNIEYLIKLTLFNNQKLRINDILIFNKKFNKVIFFHLFFPWEIKKNYKKAGFNFFKIVPLNSLDKRKNKFKNLKIYQYLKPFLYCYWIALKS